MMHVHALIRLIVCLPPNFAQLREMQNSSVRPLFGRGGAPARAKAKPCDAQPEWEAWEYSGAASTRAWVPGKIETRTRAREVQTSTTHIQRFGSSGTCQRTACASGGALDAAPGIARTRLETVECVSRLFSLRRFFTSLRHVECSCTAAGMDVQRSRDNRRRSRVHDNSGVGDTHLSRILLVFGLTRAALSCAVSRTCLLC